MIAGAEVKSTGCSWDSPADWFLSSLSLHSLFPCDHHISPGKELECVICPQCTGEEAVAQRGINEVTGSVQPLIQYFFSAPNTIPSKSQGREIFEDLDVMSRTDLSRVGDTGKFVELTN